MLSTIRELQDSLADRPPWHLAFAVWVVHGWLDGFVTTASVAYHLDSTMESNPLYRPYLAEAHLAFVHSESYIHYWKPIALKLVVAGAAALLLLVVAALVSRRVYTIFCGFLLAAGVGVVTSNLVSLGMGRFVVAVAVCLLLFLAWGRVGQEDLPTRRQMFAVALAIAMVVWAPALLTGVVPLAPSGSVHNGIAAADHSWTYNDTSHDVSTETTNPQDLWQDSDGNWWVASADAENVVYKYDSSWSYTGTSHSVSSEVDDIEGLYQDSGGNWWVTNSSSGVYKYDSTWSYTGTSHDLSLGNNMEDVHKGSNGNWWVITRDAVYEYDSNWDYTGTNHSITEASSSQSLWQDGAGHWWVVDTVDGYIYEYDSGWGYTGNSFNISGTEATPTGVFKADGGDWRVAGAEKDSVHEFTGHDFSAPDVSGQVTDQYGEPVANATVSATEIDQSNTINIGDRTLAGIYDDPTPPAWNQQINDLESFDESQFNPDFGTDEFDEQRVLMHSREDWAPQDFPDYAFYSPRVYEGTPPENIPARPVLDADQEAVFACWTPDGSLFQDGTDRSIPGAETTDCSITVEQIDPLGNRVESRTVESQPVHSVEHPSNVGEDGWLTKDHHAATLDLDPGVYKVYPEGAPEDALYYSVAEGQDPANLRPDAENWQSACDSGSTSQPWHDNVCDKLSSIGTDRTTTNATGYYGLFMGSNVDSVQLTAVKDASLDAADETMTADEVSTQFENTVESNFKAHEAATSGPRQYLENNDRESFRQICREMPSVGEEVGAPFFGLAESSVPSSSADIQGTHGTAPYADNVIKECAAANMVEDILNDNLGWLDGGFLDDLENLQDPHEKLEELLPLLLADPALQEEVEDRTGIQLDSSSPYDYTKSEARQILDEGGSALGGGSGGAGGPYVGGGGGGSVDDAAGTISETWMVSGVSGWSEAAIMVRLDWSNGTTTTLNDSSEYVTIDENVVGADEVRLEDYPLAENDPAAVKPRLDVSTPDGSDGDERPGRRNPHFDGQIPGIEHVKISTVRPGPDESVTVEVDGDDGLQGLQRVEVTNPDGSTSTVTPTDGTATVTTTGEGTHRLAVVLTNPGGTEFTEVLRLEAGSSASDRPPTVRAATGVTGRYAVASDGMQGASVDVSNGASQVDVVGLLKTDSPGQVVVDTASASIAPDVTHNVELRYGDDEQRIGTSTGLVLRQPPTSEAALHYREGRPITTSGGTEGTVTRTDNATVYDTYTAGDGTLTTRTIDDPDILQRIWFNVRVRSPIDPGAVGDSPGMIAPNVGVAA